MSLEIAQSIKNSNLCRYDTLKGFLSYFNVNGDLDGWDVYNNIYMYNSWNGVLFGNSSSNSCYIGRTDSFDYLECSTYYIVNVTMKVVPSSKSHGDLTQGRLQWITIEDNLWDTDKLYDFDIINDGKWHVYNINLGPYKYWIGHVNNIRIYPFVDGGTHAFFAIEKVSISTIDTWGCLNKSCDYYVAGNYTHPCLGAGQKGSCLAGQSKTNYNLVSNVSDELIVDIDGYGQEKFDLGNCSEFNGYDMSRRLSKHISGLSVGGYTYCEIEVDDYDRNKIKITSGSSDSNSSVDIIDSLAARELGFYDADGNDTSIKETGVDPASGFDFLSTRLLTGLEITKLIDGTIESSSYLHSPYSYSVEGGRSDYDTGSNYALTSDFTGGISFDHNMSNAYKTIIDISNPINSNGKIKYIYVVGKAYDNLDNSKVILFRPYRDGQLEVIYSFALSVETDSAVETYKVECDVLVRRGDVFGVYNTEVCVPFSFNGHPDATFYHVSSEPSGTIDPGYLYNGGSSGFPIYLKSDRKQSSVILDIDLGKRVNVEKFNVYGSKNSRFEYNISSCKDLTWTINTHGLTHTHSHRNGDIVHDNIVFGEEALNDNITVALDPYANLSFGVGDDGYWTSGAHTYCYINGDDEFDDPGVGSVIIDYRYSWLTYTLEFPNDSFCNIYKSRIYFKDPDNFRDFELSYYMGPGTIGGNISSGDITYKKINFNEVKLDGEAITDYTNNRYLRGFYENPSNDVYSANWKVLEHNFSSVAAKGFRIDCNEHTSTKLTEIELFSWFSEDTSLVDVVTAGYSSYDDVWHYVDFESDSTTSESVVYADIANSPRYLSIEFDSRAVFNINFMVLEEGTQVKLADCDNNLLLDNSKTNTVNNSTSMVLENVYDSPFDLSVDIPKQILNTDSILLWNKLGSYSDLDDSEVGPGCILHKNDNFKFLDDSSLCMKENVCYGLKNLVGGKVAYRKSNEDGWIVWDTTLREGIDVDYGSFADRIRNDLTFDNAEYKYYKIYAYDTSGGGETSIIGALGAYFNGSEVPIDTVRINVGNLFDDEIRFDTSLESDRSVSHVPITYASFPTGSGTPYSTDHSSYFSSTILWTFSNVNKVVFDTPLNSFELCIRNFNYYSGILFYDDNDNILAAVLPHYYATSGYSSVAVTTGNVQIINWSTRQYIRCEMADNLITVKRTADYFKLSSGNKELYIVEPGSIPKGLPSASTGGFTRRPFHSMGVMSADVELDAISGLGPNEMLTVGFSSPTTIDELRFYTRALDNLKYGVYAGNYGNDYTCLATSDYISSNLSEVPMATNVTNYVIAHTYTREFGINPKNVFLPWVSASSSGITQGYDYIGNGDYRLVPLPTHPATPFCCDVYDSDRFWVSNAYYPHWISYGFGAGYKRKIEQVQIIFGQKSEAYSNRSTGSYEDGYRFYTHPGGCPNELYIQGSNTGEDSSFFSDDVSNVSYNHYSDNTVGGSPSNISDNDLNTLIRDLTYIAIDLGVSNEKIVSRLRLYINTSNNISEIRKGTFYGSNNSTNGVDGDWLELIDLSVLSAPTTYPFWTYIDVATNMDSYRWYKIADLYAIYNSYFIEWELFEASIEDSSWHTLFHAIGTDITPSNLSYTGQVNEENVYAFSPVVNTYDFDNDEYYRFYRIYMLYEKADSQEWVSIYRVEMKEKFPGPGSLFDAAHNKPVEATSFVSGHIPQRANDANVSTYWSSVSGIGAVPSHWSVDLEDITSIKKISVITGVDQYAYTLAVGVDNTLFSDNRWSSTDHNLGYHSFSADYLYVSFFGGWYKIRSVFGMTTGKWYWEVNIGRSPDLFVGVDNSAARLRSYPGVDEYGWGYYYNYQRIYHGGVHEPYLPETGSRTLPLGIAIDADAGKIWFRISDEWNGNPEEGTNPAYDNVTAGEVLYPTIGVDRDYVVANATINFGASDFVYDVPLGFNSLGHRGWYTLLKEPLGNHLPTDHDDLIDLSYRYLMFTATDTDNPTNSIELSEFNVVPYGVSLESTPYNDYFAVDLGKRYALSMVRNYGTGSFTVGIDEDNTVFSSTDTSNINDVVWSEEQAFIDNFDDDIYYDNWLTADLIPELGSGFGVLFEADDKISVSDYGDTVSGTYTPLDNIAKSVVFEFADNYGYSSMGVRSIEFKLDGELIAVSNANSTTYASSTRHSNFAGWKAFNTSLTKVGSAVDTTWEGLFGASSTDQWLSIVFDLTIKFDEIVINNRHHSGGGTNFGVKNTKIYASSDEITTHTYGDLILNSAEIFDGVIDEHVASNVVDDQILDIEGFSLFDLFTPMASWYGPFMTYTLGDLAQNFNLSLTYGCANNDTTPFAGTYTVDFLHGDNSVLKLRIVNPANGEVDNIFTEYLYDSSESSSTIKVERWGENSNDHYGGLGLIDDRTMRNYSYSGVDYREVNYEGIAVGGDYQACIKFDLSAIDNAEVLEAKLFMRVRTNNSFSGPGVYKDVSLYRLYKPWISTDVCWYDYSRYNGDISWAANGAYATFDEGLDDGIYDRANTPLDTQRIYQLEYETWFNWDITDITQQWVNGEIKNYGFLAGLNTTTWAPRINFYNSWGVDGYRPYLQIKYRSSNSLIYAGTGKVAALGTNTIDLERKVSTAQLTYEINNELRYLGDVSTDYFNKVTITYGRYNTSVDYQRNPVNHYTSYFNLLALTEASDARWIRFALEFDGLSSQYIKRLGIYPDISVNLAPDGTRNCEWEDLGVGGKLLTSSYLPPRQNFALDADVSTNYVVGSCLPENAVDGDVGGVQNPGWAFDITSSGNNPYIEIDFGDIISFNSVVLHNGQSVNDRKYDNFPTMPACSEDNYRNAYSIFKMSGELPSSDLWSKSPIQFQITTTVSGNSGWFTPWMSGRTIRNSEGHIIGYYPGNITTERAEYLTINSMSDDRYDQLHFNFSPTDARRLRITFFNWESPSTTFFNSTTGQWDTFDGSFIRELEVFSSSIIEGAVYSELWPILAFDLRYPFRIVSTDYAIGGGRERVYSPSFKYSGEDYSDPQKVSFTAEDATQIYSSTDSSEILEYLNDDSVLQNTYYSFDSDLFLSQGMYALMFELYNIEDIDTMCMVLNGNIYNRIYPTNSGTLSGTGTWLSFEETVYIEEDGYFEVAGEATVSGIEGETYNNEWGIRYPSIIKTTSLRKKWLAIEAAQEAVGTMYLRWVKAYADQSFVLTEYSLWWQSLVSVLGDSINTKVGNTSLKISYPATTKSETIKYYGEGIGQDLDWHIKDSLCFWLYIDDVTKLDLDSLKVSSGKTKYASEDENAVSAYYIWKVNDIMPLTTGWNRVKLPFSEYFSYVPYTYQADPKRFLSPELDFAFNSSPFSLFQIDFYGKGQAFDMYIDDIGVERNIFNDDVKLSKGLCLVNFESLEIPLANADLGKGTVEFQYKAYTTAQGTDLFSKTYSRHLFTMSSSSDIISLGISAGYGLQITISEDIYKIYKHVVDIDTRSDYYFEFDDVVHFVLMWDNNGTSMGGSNDTIRLYIKNKLVYSSTDIWTVSDPKPSVIKLGGSSRNDCYETESIGSGIFESIKIYNYCRTSFNATEEEDVKNIYSPNDFVEISSDNINFHGSDSADLPLIFENVPASGTRTVYVRSSKDNNFVKSRGLTAGLYVEWEVSI